MNFAPSATLPERPSAHFDRLRYQWVRKRRVDTRFAWHWTQDDFFSLLGHRQVIEFPDRSEGIRDRLALDSERSDAELLRHLYFVSQSPSEEGLQINESFECWLVDDYSSVLKTLILFKLQYRAHCSRIFFLELFFRSLPGWANLELILLERIPA